MGKPRVKHEVERDQNITTEFYLKGYSTRAIAAIIGEKVGTGYTTTHKTVSQDIKKLLKQWRDDRIHDISSQKMVELQKLDKLEQTYWDAWEKSVENHRKIINKARGKGGAEKPFFQEITETEIKEFGEPRYLQGVERCIDKRCKLLGLDAPVKTELQDNSFVNFLMHTT